MPVTKESDHGEVKVLDQTQDQKSPAVEQLPEEKIPEKKDVSDTKGLLPQEDTNVPTENICSPPSAKLETQAEDDVGIVEKSEMADSSIARSEIGITVTDASSEKQHFEGTIETGYLSPSGERVASPDITTSTISLFTQSEQGTELDTHSGQGSSLQCRNCKNMYTASEDKQTSCSDLCPFCTATTTSPLHPRIPQPPGNPAKNRNTDIQIEDDSQSEEGTKDPVVVVGVEEPKRLPNSTSPPTGGPPNGSRTSPDFNQSQSNATPRGETGREGNQQDERRNNGRCCSCCCSWNCPDSLSTADKMICFITLLIFLLILLIALIRFAFPLPNSSSQDSSKPRSS